MPKKKTAKEKLRDWAEKYPARWFTVYYHDLAIETGVPRSTLYAYYPLVIAELADMLPSAVLEKRREAGGTLPRGGPKLSEEEIQRITDLFEAGTLPLDICFMTGRSLAQIMKYKPKEKTPQETTKEQTNDE